MDAASREIVVWAAESPESYGVTGGDGGRPRLSPFTREEIDRLFRGGEREVDQFDQLLVYAGRARGRIDATMAEGLHLLRQGRRLVELGYHLEDYAREVLDLGERAARSLSQLGRELPGRPLLRAALQAGEVKLRAAQTILPVAKGEAEAGWVARAKEHTVRELEALVRKAGKEPAPSDFRLAVQATEGERAVIDRALRLAGRLVPESTLAERLEMLAQEVLGTCPGDPDREFSPGREVGLQPVVRPGQVERRAALEEEQERWKHLPEPEVDWKAIEVRFEADDSAQVVDAKLRELARQRAELEQLLGYCAYAIKRGQVHRRLGFESLGHYVEERLGLPPRAVEQRVALEEQVQGSPALQALRDEGLSYERLRILARLPEADRIAWREQAGAMTCAELRASVEEEKDAQMRAASKVTALVPRRIALLLAALVHGVRENFGRLLSVGRCLTLAAYHFILTWSGFEKRRRTRSQQVRERDGHRCQVPGCSHQGTHSHHVEFRSHGGSDALDNQAGLCPFHHLICIHEGPLTVHRDEETGELVWMLGAEHFTGLPAPFAVVR